MAPQPRTMHSSRTARCWAAFGLALVALLLAGCGSPDVGRAAADSPVADPRGGEAFPADVLSGQVGDGTQITIGERPSSIVSLSPTATETLWAVGAGDQVVAVDDQSNYPAGVPATKLSGYTPNVEAILAFEPDLVLSSGDGGDLVAGLEKAGVPTLLLPAATDLDDAYSQIERIGAATGHVAEAAKVVAEMRSDIRSAVADAPRAAGLTYFHELDPTLYTVTGKTFIGEVYGLFGMTSIGDGAAGGDDYPQLSAEYVVDVDPDLVMLADTDCCEVTPEKIADRPGWDDLTAVRTGQLHEIDKDISSRWGPRIVDFVRAIGDVVADVEPAPAS